jgi:hypothetical protein
VKKTVHSDRNKPTTTVELPVAAELAALLFPSGPKVQFTSASALLDWLPGLPKTVSQLFPSQGHPSR